MSSLGEFYASNDTIVSSDEFWKVFTFFFFLNSSCYYCLCYVIYLICAIFWLLSQMLRHYLLGSYIHLINVFSFLFSACWHISLLPWVCLSAIATRILLCLCVQFSHSTTKAFSKYITTNNTSAMLLNY